MKFRKKIFIIFLNIFLALLLIELVLRCLGFAYNLFYKPPKVTDSQYKILCIGESTTWGSGTADPRQDGYPKQLEDLLKKRYPDKTIKCFFDQTIGQNTSEILLKLPGYLKKYDPDLVIFMVGANNWWNLNNSNILLFNKNSAVSDFSLKAFIFLDKFRVWKLIKWAKLSLVDGNRWNRAFTGNPLEGIKAWQREATLVYYRLTEYDISTMLEICKKSGLKVIVCNYPMLGWDMDTPSGEGVSLDFLIEEIAMKSEVPFVDNHASFVNSPFLGDLLSRDKWHPNKKGYSLVAGNVFNCIAENQFIEKK